MRFHLPLVICFLFVLLVIAGCSAPGTGSTNNSVPTPPVNPPTVTNSHATHAGQDQVRTARVNDIDIAYRESGQGKPLVLITGYGATMDLWPEDVLSNLSLNHRVIVFDNRGMGNTSTSGREFSLPLFADDTAGLMAALNISSADVLGWSMGADIAQELALRHPGNVNRLILYAGSPGGNESIPASPAVLEQLTNTSGSAQEQGQRLFTLLFPADWLRKHPDPRTFFPTPTEISPRQSYIRQAEAISSWSGTYSRLPGIQSPTLVLTGAEDVISVPENALVLGGRIPGAWVIQVSGGGHGMMYQFPDEFDRIVNFFLES